MARIGNGAYYPSEGHAATLDASRQPGKPGSHGNGMGAGSMHLFGKATLVRVLTAKTAQEAGGSSIRDYFSKSGSDRETKSGQTKALFESIRYHRGGDAGSVTAFSAHTLLRNVLDSAKPEALSVIRATVGRGDTLHLSIGGKETAYKIDYRDSDTRALDRLVLAHDLSLQAAARVKGATADQIGALRNAVVAALDARDAVKILPSLAGAVSFDTGVREALADLGLPTSILSAERDKSGRETFALSDLQADVKAYFSGSKGEKKAADAVSKLFSGTDLKMAPGASLLQLTSKLRNLGEPLRRSDFQASHTIGQDTVFDFRLGNRRISLPVAGSRDEIATLTRAIEADGLREKILTAALQGSGSGATRREANEFSNYIGPMISQALDKEPPHIRADSLGLIVENLDRDARVLRDIATQAAGSDGEDTDKRMRNYLANLELAELPPGTVEDRDRQSNAILAKYRLADIHTGESKPTLFAHSADRSDKARSPSRSEERQAMAAQQIDADENVDYLKRLSANTLITGLSISLFEENVAGGSAHILVNGMPVVDTPIPERQRSPSTATTVSIGDDLASRTDSVWGGDWDVSRRQSPSDASSTSWLENELPPLPDDY